MGFKERWGLRRALGVSCSTADGLKFLACLVIFIDPVRRVDSGDIDYLPPSSWRCAKEMIDGNQNEDGNSRVSSNHEDETA